MMWIKGWLVTVFGMLLIWHVAPPVAHPQVARSSSVNASRVMETVSSLTPAVHGGTSPRDASKERSGSLSSPSIGNASLAPDGLGWLSTSASPSPLTPGRPSRLSGRIQVSWALPPLLSTLLTLLHDV
ncbi:MAG: hypothetical protein OWU84_14600 [Firmicutes bacterium]|nr:hypothetical protein [Bacillota bacterium]